MATQVYLHIGAPKTGTTYLQDRCESNASGLREQGLLFPRPMIDHFRMMLGALDQLYAAQYRRRAAAALPRLVEKTKSWSGRVLISCELFAAASAGQVVRLCEELAPAEVHVIYTVRDLSRILPAEWQQAVKGGYTTPFGAYVSSIINSYGEPLTSVPTVVGPEQAVDKFRALHRLDDVLARWSAAVRPEHMHVVTLPPSGSDPEVLWQRFCSVIGVEPTSAAAPAERSNESLGAAEVELLRRINLRSEELGGYDLAAREWVRFEFTLPYLMQRGRRRPLSIGTDAHAWTRAEAQRLASYLDQSPHDVVGTPNDLIPPQEPRDGVHPDDVSADDVQAVSVDAVVHLLRQLRRDS